MTDIRNTEQLRTALLQCIGDVRSGKLDPSAGTTIAKLGKEVISSARLDLQWMRMTKAKSDTQPESVVLLNGKKRGRQALSK